MEWQPISTAPKDGRFSFLVLMPGNDVADFVVLQVSNFEGRMYADGKDAIIDYQDAITSATHWQPLPLPPNASTGRSDT